MTRGTALVTTVARVVQLTGQQDLANLESSGQLTVTDLLVTASDTIYDRLEGDGVDPTLLTNETAYERAVAWELLSSLFALGYIGEDPQSDFERAQASVERHYAMVKPKTSAADAGRRANEAVPVLGNFEQGWAYGGGTDPRRDAYRTWMPRRQD